LMLLASYNRASKALEKSAVALSESRQLLLEAEKLLAERETCSGKAGAVAKRVEIGRRVFGRDDAIRSSGEVNGLIGWSLRQGLPSIDFTHGDLA
jgi:hypothetical protein